MKSILSLLKEAKGDEVASSPSARTIVLDTRCITQTVEIDKIMLSMLEPHELLSFTSLNRFFSVLANEVINSKSYLEHLYSALGLVEEKSETQSKINEIKEKIPRPDILYSIFYDYINTEIKKANEIQDTEQKQSILEFCDERQTVNYKKALLVYNQYPDDLRIMLTEWTSSPERANALMKNPFLVGVLSKNVARITADDFQKKEMFSRSRHYQAGINALQSRTLWLALIFCVALTNYFHERKTANILSVIFTCAMAFCFYDKYKTELNTAVHSPGQLIKDHAKTNGTATQFNKTNRALWQASRKPVQTQANDSTTLSIHPTKFKQP